MTPKRTDFRFLDRLRVRWAEVDMQRIVFNGHYLMYFDTAIASYWRALALPYHETMEALEGDLFVRKATVEYTGSARYEDQLDVGIRTQRVGNTSMVLACAAFRGEQFLVGGELVYVFADPATMRSKPVPHKLRDLLQSFEAGQSMIELRLGRWDELGPAASNIRKQVFIEEQKIPAERSTTAPTRTASTHSRATASGCPWPPGGCMSLRPASARSAGWRCWHRCAAAASAAGFSTGWSTARVIGASAR
jgi:YbgC/YbaW family acyl-CoA thioester hydrolase